MITVHPDDRPGFPDRPFRVRHPYVPEPRLEKAALVALSATLPTDLVEYNLGDLAVNQDPSGVRSNSMSVQETIERIGENRSWLVMKNIERDAGYAALLRESLAAVDTMIRPVFPGVFGLEGFLFVSSPGSVTPFHADPEHNFLFQIRGTKTIHIWDKDDRHVMPDAALEAACVGAHRNLPYRDDFEPRGQVFTLLPGDGLYFPVRAPHWVQNGPDVSISYSFTFRSEVSERQRKSGAVNAVLRRVGLVPRGTGASERLDRLKAAAFDALSVPIGVARRSDTAKAFLLRRAR